MFRPGTHLQAMTRIALLFLCLALLAGCGGMNRAVGVLPDTLDDLEARSAIARGAPDDMVNPGPADTAPATR
ncbi:hypothetical protein VQ042_12445 [Aurantimonas sp. A2-1-M11]|uniref:hypothetical protein n=1 Tax=Aurantimonas sp. A2-1-M11 TaxID=3113712 RepID=UPI002F93D10D